MSLNTLIVGLLFSIFSLQCVSTNGEEAWCESAVWVSPSVAATPSPAGVRRIHWEETEGWDHWRLAEYAVNHVDRVNQAAALRACAACGADLLYVTGSHENAYVTEQLQQRSYWMGYKTDSAQSLAKDSWYWINGRGVNRALDQWNPYNPPNPNYDVTGAACARISGIRGYWFDGPCDGSAAYGYVCKRERFDPIPLIIGVTVPAGCILLVLLVILYTKGCPRRCKCKKKKSYHEEEEDYYTDDKVAHAEQNFPAVVGDKQSLVSQYPPPRPIPPINAYDNRAYSHDGLDGVVTVYPNDNSNDKQFHDKSQTSNGQPLTAEHFITDVASAAPGEIAPDRDTSATHTPADTPATRTPPDTPDTRSVSTDTVDTQPDADTSATHTSDDTSDTLSDFVVVGTPPTRRTSEFEIIAPPSPR